MSWRSCGGSLSLAARNLIRFFTLAAADEAFLRKFRGRDEVLGAAVQLCTLPWLGFVPDNVAPAPVAAVARLWQRLGESRSPKPRGYGGREQTRTGHLRGQTTAANTPACDVEARKARYRYGDERWSRQIRLYAHRLDHAHSVPRPGRGPGVCAGHSIVVVGL